MTLGNNQNWQSASQFNEHYYPQNAFVGFIGVNNAFVGKVDKMRFPSIVANGGRELVALILPMPKFADHNLLTRLRPARGFFGCGFCGQITAFDGKVCESVYMGDLSASVYPCLEMKSLLSKSPTTAKTANLRRVIVCHYIGLQKIAAPWIIPPNRLTNQSSFPQRRESTN